jgi:hypothetical protein
MRRRSQAFLALTIIATAFGTSSVGAQGSVYFGDTPPTTDLTASQRTFAKAYLAAVTGSDIERYKQLLHPATLACMNSDNADYFQSIFARRTGKVATSPILSIETLPEKFEMIDAMNAQGWIYSVRPTHVFHIDLVSTGPKQSTIGAFAVFDNGAWYEVLPCPSAKTLDDLKQALQKRR